MFIYNYIHFRVKTVIKPVQLKHEKLINLSKTILTDRSGIKISNVLKL